MIDIISPTALEIVISNDGKQVWFNDEDGCLFRAYNIKRLTLDDRRTPEVAWRNEMEKQQ